MYSSHSHAIGPIAGPSTSGRASSLPLYSASLARRGSEAQGRALGASSWRSGNSMSTTTSRLRECGHSDAWQTSLLPASDQLTSTVSRRRQMWTLHATKGGGSTGSGKGSSSGSGAPAGKGEESKADFSALWAQRFKQFFSARRQYLQAADVTPEDEAKKKDYDKRIAADRVKLAQLKAEYVRDQGVLVEQDNLATIEAMKAVELEMLKQRNASPEELAAAASASYGLSPEKRLEVDVTQARAELKTNPRIKIAMGVARTRDLIKAAILFPFTAVLSLHASWRSIFESQSYQNFLMSEGERMWFWRNRMENERWFWEKFAWDRLVLPILCAVGYQLITPPNFLFAVLLPLALSLWQHGRIPSVISIDFAAIAYLGFYKKCWPQWSNGISAFVFGW